MLSKVMEYLLFLVCDRNEPSWILVVFCFLYCYSTFTIHRKVHGPLDKRCSRTSSKSTLYN